MVLGPIPGIDYSSQNFSAGLEVELSDSADENAIREKVSRLYRLLEQTEDQQIAAKQPETTRERLQRGRDFRPARSKRAWGIRTSGLRSHTPISTQKPPSKSAPLFGLKSRKSYHTIITHPP